MEKVAIVGCGSYMDQGYGCPYTSPQDLADIIQSKTGIEVVTGTHDYH